MPDHRYIALTLFFRRASVGTLITAIVVSMAACTTHRQEPDVPPVVQDRGADRATIAALKVGHWRDLYRNQDAAGLDAFLADNFVLLNADGTVSTKQEEVQWLASHPWSGPDDFLYTIVDIVFAGGDAAIVYGNGDSTRSLPDGTPCHHRYWSSNALVRSGGSWRPVFSHVSGVSCEPLNMLADNNTATR